MKKAVLICLAAAGLLACSTEDTETVSSDTSQHEPVRWYKMVYNTGNIPMDQLVYKTKTGDGPWVEQQLDNRRFVVHHGDSVHIYTSSFIPDVQNFVLLQVHNRVAWIDETNYSCTISRWSAPINKKFKLEFPQYDEYPLY